MGSLKSFIKAVRAAKTIADERTVIQKESAAVRTSFRDQKTSHQTRRENVAKLLYLFTIGERTHFGQVECLKLLASPHFADKRLGYLGSMLLLDENQEILMLITNSLDTDLDHPNQYVVSLALCTLANIASASMARDLFPKVEKLIASTNSNLRRKAALCALRIVRKVPELEESFIESCKDCLLHSNNGVALCGASLAIELIDNNPDLVMHFTPLLPDLIARLKALSVSGFSPEYDVQGIPDPFLQTRLIRLLRAIGQDNAVESEKMSDILAAIATNTDSTKNVGNAVLFEAVLAIFGIEADSSLRVLATNILGKFLTTKDNNSRYVALNTLTRAVIIEPAAVQRHRATIIECFNDNDVSIRKRALELSFALINESNVRVIVKELHAFLEYCDVEFKAQIVSEIALACERYAPNRKWHIDTLFKTFVLAGSYVKENILSAFIILVIDSKELQLYIIQKLYAALQKDHKQEGLALTAIWLVAEHADILLKGGDFTYENEQVRISEAALVDLLLNILRQNINVKIEDYCINGLAKVSTKIQGPQLKQKIQDSLSGLRRSIVTDIQQRAVEYTLLARDESLAKGIFARMPLPENGDDLEAQHAKAMSKALVRRKKRVPFSSGKAAKAADEKTVASLLDFDVAPVAQETNQTDILASILAQATTSVPPVAAEPAAALVAAAPSSQFSHPAVRAIESSYLTVEFGVVASKAGEISLTAVIQSKGQPVQNLHLQVAVPKSQHLALQPMSSPVLSALGSATQNMTISGTPGSPVRLRLRLSYMVHGESHMEQADFSGLPVGL